MDIKRFYKKVSNIIGKDGYECLLEEDTFIKKIGEGYHKICFVHELFQDENTKDDFDESIVIKDFVFISELSNEDFLLGQSYLGFGIFNSSKSVLNVFEQQYNFKMKPRIALLFPIAEYVTLIDNELPDLSSSLTDIWIDIHDGRPMIDDNLMRLNVAIVNRFLKDRKEEILTFYKSVVIESNQIRSIKAYNSLLKEFE